MKIICAGVLSNTYSVKGEMREKVRSRIILGTFGTRVSRWGHAYRFDNNVPFSQELGK